MASIAKLLLWKKEEKLACLLAAYYKIAVDEELIKKAIELEMYEFLNFLWAFRKNIRGQWWSGPPKP